MPDVKIIAKPDQERWCAQWGYADSQGFGIGSGLGLLEFVTWDAADHQMQIMVERFTSQEQADHDAINPESRGQTPEAVSLLERRLAEQRPRGEDWACRVESITGHTYLFLVEYDGPGE
jgi:hypothetical protein